MTHQEGCRTIVDLAALLIEHRRATIGIGPDGRRRVLGCSVPFSEAQMRWRSFFRASSIAAYGV